MKILWFANTPCSASEILLPNQQRGGWLKSLENEIAIRPGIELSIGFYTNKTLDIFRYNDTTYYPITRFSSGSALKKAIKRITGTGNDEKEIPVLLEVIEKVRPDIIHIHGTEQNFGLLVKQVAIPSVVSIQGILSPYNEKYYSGIPESIVSRYESRKHKILFKSFATSKRDMAAHAKREREILAAATNVIGRTEWDKRITRILAPRSTYYNNNEMLRTAFYNIAWQKTKFNKTIRIVTISSNGLFKGFESVVKTAEVLNTYKGIRFEWIIIGINEYDSIVQIVKKWLRADLSALNIELLGTKTQEEITKLLQEADIYCQVSHIENSPNSLCEAMLMGMPVIATHAGGTSTMMEDRKEGVLIQEGDAYSMAGAIVELAENFPLAAAYGAHARQKALVRHDKKEIADGLIHIYQSIIKLNN